MHYKKANSRTLHIFCRNIKCVKPDTNGFALIDARRLDKVRPSAKIKNAFPGGKGDGDVAEWLKAAVC